MKSKEHHLHLACGFCGKSQRQVRKLIAGPTVYICDECIKLCHDLISEQTGDAPTSRSIAKTARSLALDLLEACRMARQLKVPAIIPREVARRADQLAKELERLASRDEEFGAVSKPPHNVCCCSFCGNSQEKALKLIGGPSVYICDGCVKLCHEIITEHFVDLEQFAEMARKLLLDMKIFPMIHPTTVDDANLLAEELRQLAMSDEKQ